jgi:hypothetical protein
MRPHDKPRRSATPHPRRLERGQTAQLDQAPAESKTVYTTERPDGLLVAHESRPVGFGPQVEAWDLELQ